MTGLKKLADRLDNAMAEFASANGDRFYQRDNLGARDLRDEGYEIAAQAAKYLKRVEWQDFVAVELGKKPDFGIDVVAAAAWYRLAELSQ